MNLALVFVQTPGPGPLIWLSWSHFSRQHSLVLYAEPRPDRHLFRWTWKPQIMDAAYNVMVACRAEYAADMYAGGSYRWALHEHPRDDLARRSAAGTDLAPACRHALRCSGLGWTEDWLGRFWEEALVH